MNNKEKIKLKIRALLAKTTDNGATEAEMMEAMQKASELMEKYYIDPNDLNDPFLGERCIFMVTPLHVSQYDTKQFLPFLARLFDCEYYYNKHKKELTFFGFENDAELAVFFYNTVIRALTSEFAKYQQSYEFRREQRYFPTKTVKNSFIKGFIYRVAEKLNDLYKRRQAERTKERGLILREKSQKVKDAFLAEDINVRTTRARVPSVVNDIFDQGRAAGDAFNVVQGIKQGETAIVKRIG